MLNRKDRLKFDFKKVKEKKMNSDLDLWRRLLSCFSYSHTEMGIFFGSLQLPKIRQVLLSIFELWH